MRKPIYLTARVDLTAENPRETEYYYIYDDGSEELHRKSLVRKLERGFKDINRELDELYKKYM